MLDLYDTYVYHCIITYSFHKILRVGELSFKGSFFSFRFGKWLGLPRRHGASTLGSSSCLKDMISIYIRTT